MAQRACALDAVAVMASGGSAPPARAVTRQQAPHTHTSGQQPDLREERANAGASHTQVKRANAEQGAFYTRAGGVRSGSSPEHILGRAALAGEQTATSFWRNLGASLKNVSVSHCVAGPR